MTSQLRIISTVPGSDKANNMIFARRQNQALLKRGILCKEVILPHSRNLSKIFLHIFILHSELKKFDPMIIHAQYGTYTAFLCSLFSFQYNFIITFRGSDLNLDANIRNTSFIHGIFGHLLSQFSAIFAHRIICVSSRLKEKIWFGRAKSIVIPDGVDLESFVLGSIDDARSRLEIPKEFKVLLFNSGYNPIVKRKDLSDEVARVLKTRIENFKYLVMEGHVSSDLVPVYMQASDCLLITSDNEGSPCVVKEAMASGLPIVSVNVGDVAEMTKGASQCFIAKQEVDDLVKRVVDTFIKGKRSNGRNFSYRYDMNVCIDRIIHLYQQVIKYS